MHFLRNTWDLLLRMALAAAAFWQAQWADASLRLLVGLMIVDWLAALIASLLGHSRKTPGGGLSSLIGLRGILKKILILLTVTAAGLMDALIGDPSPMLRHAVTLFYAANEALSLLENLALAGIPIPVKLRSALEVMRKGT